MCSYYGFNWRRKGKLTLDNNIICVIISRRRQIEFHKLIMTIAQHFDLQPQQEIIGTQSMLHNCHQYGAFAFKALQTDYTLICPKILLVRRKQITHSEHVHRFAAAPKALHAHTGLHATGTP